MFELDDLEEIDLGTQFTTPRSAKQVRAWKELCNRRVEHAKTKTPLWVRQLRWYEGQRHRYG